MNGMADNCFIGIDPGKTGAACLINSRRIIDIHDFDGVKNTAEKMKQWFFRFNVKEIWLEDVHSFPTDGHVQAFRFGKNFGAWQGIFCAIHNPNSESPLKLISPKQWRKGIYTPGDRSQLKKRSLDAARRIFPDAAEYFRLERDHNRAEAALIAYQAMRKNMRLDLKA